MTQGVAAGLDDLQPGVAKLDAVAAGDHAIQRRDPPHLRRPDDRRAGFGLEPCVAAGVVGMPVGVEDEVEPVPSLRPQSGEDRLGVGRVDATHRAAGLVAHEEAIVVGEAGKLADGQAHGDTAMPMMG